MSLLNSAKETARFTDSILYEIESLLLQPENRTPVLEYVRARREQLKDRNSMLWTSEW